MVVFYAVIMHVLIKVNLVLTALFKMYILASVSSSDFCSYLDKNEVPESTTKVAAL